MESLWQSDTLVQQRGAFVIHFSHPSALQRNFDLMRQENLRRKEFHLSSLARHQREILESLPLLFHLDL
ncbi:MAG TPA: hypothetical protein VLM37_10410, partial [Fibrobacteraceae bacterium]|nr:hypothetical protein [Fibrobacteraceae bacterium]